MNRLIKSTGIYSVWIIWALLSSLFLLMTTSSPTSAAPPLNASGVNPSDSVDGPSPDPAQGAPPGDNPWRDISEVALRGQGDRLIIPDKYRLVEVDLTALDSLLGRAPLENSATAQSAEVVMALPLPDGTFGRFRIEESPLMEPTLAAKYPQIKTYQGWGLDDPSATARLDRTPAGFHGFILSNSDTVYIDPYRRGDITHYISYYRRDYRNIWGKLRNEGPMPSLSAQALPELARSGPTLRTYRLAGAATGEYTQFHDDGNNGNGDATADALAAINTTMNRVNGIYLRELSVRMILVGNNNLIVYTDATTDPYTNGNPGAMIAENQTNVNSVIGSANYDIGHVFGTNSGGLASLGAVCNNAIKARGVTGSAAPIGDTFDVDYVAHEMGHQFGANHTFNASTASNCDAANRNAGTAYEPGSGTTIMAYAGICGGQDLQSNSDDHFHTISHDEIINYVTVGGGSSCGVATTTGNTFPAVNAGSDFTIPRQTPFMLTGSATDPDGNPLTYHWEEFDLGTDWTNAATLPNTDADGNARPILRSFKPVTVTFRTLPGLASILNGTNSNSGESLPTIDRVMQFRFTARDNLGGVDSDGMAVTVENDAGPFAVTSPNTPLTWGGSSSQTVTWDVANSTAAPVSCANVNIIFSTDGGQTFPITLAANTANDGSEAITVPNIQTSTARVKVECAGNIFFDISNSDITVNSGMITLHACTDPNANGLCTDPVDGPAPAAVEGCLDGVGCQPIPANFTGLASGTYTAFLRFPGASQGYYPTSGRTPITLADGAEEELTLGAVYPIHPKGVAVHAELNKAYVAFQGPVVISGTERTKPYPFVAVINGDTDEVLYTIPGGPDGAVDPSPHAPNFAGIGRGPWGVSVSGDGKFVYVGSFEDGLVTYIDPISDAVVTNYFFGSDFKPAAPAVNPVTGLVHFPDYEQGNMLILSTDPSNAQVAAPFIENPPLAFSPFEMVSASTIGSYNFVTLRDAIQPNPFKFVGVPSASPFDLTFHDINLPSGGSGAPHALGLWQATGQNRLFITYADDPRDDPTPPDFINANKLLRYDFDPGNPTSVTPAGQSDLGRDYAEAGLVYNPGANHLLGTYAGFAYAETGDHIAACNSTDRGGIYISDFDGNVTEGPQPGIVVGNPPLTGDDLQWKNPFEIALNPNNDKVYVTDRCWNEFPGGGQPGGGAVLIFQDTITEPPTPTPTVTVTPTVTATATPTITATPSGTTTPTPTPLPSQISLVMNGPTSVAPSETFSVTVVAENVPPPGLYGVQVEINYDPDLISAGTLQVNPAFSYTLFSDADNTLGRIRFVATLQGNVSGLTGDVSLFTFDATAADTPGVATLTFGEAKIGDSLAQAFSVTSQSYTVSIGGTPTPEATTTPAPETPTPTTETPTSTPETPTSTPETPTSTPETPTATPETPTPETPTPTPTPSSPTPGPNGATVSGQVILPGRAGNDWSGATVALSDVLTMTTFTTGSFSFTDVPGGTYPNVTADAPGYLPAICDTLTVTGPEEFLNIIMLLSGDVNDNGAVDALDATSIGVSFGLSGPDLPADINRDGVVDVFDLILVSLNFGQTGPQVWDCQ